jgi:hypothetical protein
MFTTLDHTGPRPVAAGTVASAIGASAHLLRAVLVVALTVGASVVAVPDSASAAVPGLVRVAASSAYDSTSPKRVQAYCPAGKSVIGGGAEIVDGQGDVLLTAAQFFGLSQSFFAEAYEQRTGFTGNWSINVYALCANPLPGLVQVIGAVDAGNSTNPKFKSVSCPTGKQLLSTGFRIIGNAVGEVGLTFLIPDASLTTVHLGAHELGGFGTLRNWGMQVEGMCADPIPGLERISVTSAADSISPKSSRAICPAGKRATGVGAETGGLGWRGAIEALKPNNLTPTSATATGVEHGSYSGDWTVTSHVICATA